MIKKQLYIIPETEVLEVRFEENIMSPQFSLKGTELMTTDDEEDF